MFSKSGVFGVFLLGIVFVLWNMLGEYYLIQSIPILAAYTIAWLSAPGSVMLLTTLTKKQKHIREYFWISVIYSSFFSIYALDGSTREMNGAEHLHLLLVPPITWLMFCVLGIMRVYDRFRRRGSATPNR